MIFHEGFLWLGIPILVDFMFITAITFLPVAGMDPTPLLKKDQEVTIARLVKKKYGIQRSKIGFLICTINNAIVSFVDKVLVSKLLRKISSDHYMEGTIALMEFCMVGN